MEELTNKTNPKIDASKIETLEDDKLIFKLMNLTVNKENVSDSDYESLKHLLHDN